MVPTPWFHQSLRMEILSMAENMSGFRRTLVPRNSDEGHSPFLVVIRPYCTSDGPYHVVMVHFAPTARKEMPPISTNLSDHLGPVGSPRCYFRTDAKGLTQLQARFEGCAVPAREYLGMLKIDSPREDRFLPIRDRRCFDALFMAADTPESLRVIKRLERETHEVRDSTKYDAEGFRVRPEQFDVIWRSHDLSEPCMNLIAATIGGHRMVNFGIRLKESIQEIANTNKLSLEVVFAAPPKSGWEDAGVRNLISRLSYGVRGACADHCVAYGRTRRGTMFWMTPALADQLIACDPIKLRAANGRERGNYLQGMMRAALLPANMVQIHDDIRAANLPEAKPMRGEWPLQEYYERQAVQELPCRLLVQRTVDGFDARWRWQADRDEAMLPGAEVTEIKTVARDLASATRLCRELPNSVDLPTPEPNRRLGTIGVQAKVRQSSKKWKAAVDQVIPESVQVAYSRFLAIAEGEAMFPPIQDAYVQQWVADHRFLEYPMATVRVYRYPEGGLWATWGWVGGPEKEWDLKVLDQCSLTPAKVPSPLEFLGVPLKVQEFNVSPSRLVVCSKALREPDWAMSDPLRTWLQDNYGWVLGALPRDVTELITKAREVLAEEDPTPVTSESA